MVRQEGAAERAVAEREEPTRKERKVHYGDEILTIDLEDVFD